MRRARSILAGRGLLAAAAVAVLLGSATGCSYLEWRREEELRSELAKTPRNFAPEKEYAPQDCYGLAGRVAVPEAAKGPLLVAAFQHASPTHELPGSREVIRRPGDYGLLHPTGSYDLDREALKELARVLEAATAKGNS